jgi:hypothetical protein
MFTFVLSITNNKTLKAMRTITTTIHTFAELSERAKNTAIEQLRGINVDYSWWDSVYEDAARIGLRIESFDLCRNRHAKGSFDLCADDVARAILSEHGDHCNTYTLGASFLSSRDELVPRYSDGVNTSVVAEGNEYDFDKQSETFIGCIIEPKCSTIKYIRMKNVLQVCGSKG